MANLTQLRMLEELNAVLLVDKPAGISFATVVKTVKRKFNLVKVGHGGSLDAAATGLLVLLINDANKFVGDIMGADRSWEGTMRLGVRTNTGDAQGEPVGAGSGGGASGGGRGDWDAAMKEFRGDIFQTEPRFCAVRREGTAGYEIADTGEHKPFLAHVWSFEAKKPETVAPGALVPFSVVATKGLILRSLAQDFGEFLGCGAILENCRRTRVGKFSVEDAIPFDKLLDTAIGDFASCTIPLGKALR